MQVQKTVFISYRRTNMYMARAVYQDLRGHGYDAFLDMERLDSGDFSQGLMTQIAARAHFVLILTPSALERCTSPDDWVRKEIEYAIEQQRNIVPLLFEGVKFEQIRHFLVSERLKLLESYNALTVPDDYFDEAMDRLRGSRYLDRDVATVLHLVAAVAAAAVAEQAKADAAPAPTPEQLEAEQLFEQGFRKSRLMSDYDGAIEAYTQAIALKTDYVDSYYRRGWVHHRKGDFDEAIADYSEVIRLKPQFEWVYYNRGRAQYDKKDYDGAIADYSEAIRLKPQFARAYILRGLAYGKKKEYDAAIADFSETIRLDPQCTDAYVGRGLAYSKKEDYDEAIADYSEAIRLDPQDKIAYKDRGIVYHKKRDYEEAIGDYEAALRIDPNYEWAKKNLEKAQRTKDKS